MKKISRRLLLVIATVLAALCLVLGACGGGAVKLTFETNGAPAVEAMEVAKGEQYTLPQPVWEGYSFEGWFTDAQFTGSPVTTGTAEENVTFYAKWEKQAVITLDLGGGSLSAGTTLYLKANENLYQFMKDYVPEKADSRFGAWYIGDKELSSSYPMPAEGVKLTAHYMTKYTVEVYLQTLDGTSYEKGEDVIDYAYAGTPMTPAPDIHGFSVVDNDEAITTKTISENASENLFRLYFDRLTYNVFFVPAYPDGTQADPIEESYLFGTSIELPFDLFARAGYLFEGWATSATGEAVYRVDFDAMCYNGSGEQAAAEMTVEDDVMLYGVWAHGYVDIFGGADGIYLFDENSEDIYLYRGGLLFKGTYNHDAGSFNFVDNNKVLLLGKIYPDGTYAYSNEDRRGFSRTLFIPGVGLDNSTKIYFDAYDGITYSVEKTAGLGSVTEDSKGTYRIDDLGLIIATFTSGPLQDQTLTIRIVNSVNDTPIAAFAVRNEEEYSWGVMYRGVIHEGAFSYYTQAYLLSLDGFGNALLIMGTSYSTYYYRREGDIITLINSSSQVYGVLCRYPEQINGNSIYTVYDADTDHVYTDANGNRLELDGNVGAVYYEGNTVTEGYYAVSGSAFGTVVHFYPQNGAARNFLATEKSDVSYDDAGQPIESVTYSFTEKPLTYGEYYYVADGPYYAPLIVFGDTMETADQVTVYGYDPQARTYAKVLLGSVEYNEKTQTYLFTTLTHYEFPEEISTAIVDYTQLVAFTFGLDTYTASSIFSGTTYYPVAYWYTATFGDGTTNSDEDYSILYHQAEGDATLTLVGEFAVLIDGDTVTAGQYSISQAGIMTIEPYGGETVTYLELDQEAHTFVLLDDLLGTAYGIDIRTGSSNTNESIAFNGKGGATYTLGEDVTEGTYERTEDVTESGNYIFKFTSSGSETKFDFILIPTSSSVYFARYNEKYAGTFTDYETGEELVLDGYGYYAAYTNSSSTTIRGSYYMPEDDAVVFIFALESTQYMIYFDLTEDSFTIRGPEYGSYIVFDNNGTVGIFLEFDGYGKVVVYTLSDEENEDGEYDRIVIDENGEYERTENGYKITYHDGNSTKELRGARGTVTISNLTLRAFFIEHLEVVHTYVNVTDWSVLVLDAYGNVTKYLADGSIERGTYSLFTSELLYYVNASGTDACVYRYDEQAGTVREIRYQQRGYYTEDLEALLFSEAGFMVAGGETRYYYDVAADGTVTLYHQDQESADKNEYGYVSERFVGFQPSIEWGGKIYYENDGFAINFVRNEQNKDKYPVQIGTQDDEPVMASFEQLTFAPTGGSEFTVRGRINLNSQTYECYVIREVSEEGVVSLYAVIGNYRLDLTVHYEGSVGSLQNANNYSVTAMRSEQGFYASTYLSYYYLYYMFTGQGISNSFGYITFVREFNEEGILTEEYLNGLFFENSGVRDSLGNIINLEKAKYEPMKNAAGEPIVNRYVVDYTGEDQIKYHFYIGLSSEYYSVFGVYSYDLVFCREDTIETEDGYTVLVERVASSGAFYNVKLSKAEQEISATTIYVNGNEFIYIVRTFDEDGVTITDSTYYNILLVEGENMDDETLPEYVSATVTETKVKTYYSENGANYVDVDETNHKVLLIAYNNTVFPIESSEYSAESGYAATTYSGRVFTVTIDENGKATVTEVEEPEEPEAPETQED